MSDISEFELLPDVLNELGYTDEADEDCKQRIMRYIRQGIARLNEIAGAEINFSSDIVSAALLFDYCRYANSQCLENFEPNFREALNALNEKYNLLAIQEEENGD